MKNTRLSSLDLYYQIKLATKVTSLSHRTRLYRSSISSLADRMATCNWQMAHMFSLTSFSLFLCLSPVPICVIITLIKSFEVCSLLVTQNESLHLKFILCFYFPPYFFLFILFIPWMCLEYLSGGYELLFIFFSSSSLFIYFLVKSFCEGNQALQSIFHREISILFHSKIDLLWLEALCRIYCVYLAVKLIMLMNNSLTGENCSAF